MRVRLPRRPLSRPSFDWLAGINGWHALFYVLYTLSLFAVFLVATFPYHVVVERAVHEVDVTPFAIEVGGTRFAWYKGIKMSSVRLVRAGHGPEVPPIFNASALYIHPAIGDLFRAKLTSLTAYAPMYGGEVEARWAANRRTRRIALNLSALHLARYRPLLDLLEEGEVHGLLSGSVTLESRNGDLRQGRAAGELRLTRASLLAAKINGFGLPDLRIGKTTAKFSVRGGRLEIQSFRAEGEEVKVSASGQIVFRHPFTQSVLNLRVSLHPGPGSPEAIRGLLAMLPHAKTGRPDAPISITGTLVQPRFK